MSFTSRLRMVENEELALTREPEGTKLTPRVRRCRGRRLAGVRGAVHSGMVVSTFSATFQPSHWLGDQAGFPVTRKDRGPSAAGRCSVLSWETLRARDDRRARRRTELAPLEQLEGRQLMAYTSLGYSLPDLHVTGQAGPVASLGRAPDRHGHPSEYRGQHHQRALSLIPPSQVAHRARRPARSTRMRRRARPTCQPTRLTSIR